MAGNDIPKLFVNVDPGAILIGAVRDFCRSWTSQTEVTVPGSHFVQEDSGPAIGRADEGKLCYSGMGGAVAIRRGQGTPCHYRVG